MQVKNSSECVCVCMCVCARVCVCVLTDVRDTGLYVTSDVVKEENRLVTS